MILENELGKILLNIGKDIKIHQIDDDNSIIEIDYQKYIAEIMELFKTYLEE
jgi:hypothetical protein